ncbi:MAG: metallophosphoesterase family protein [Chloroflexota bacterium]
MRFAIFSDVHGNLTALEAVLKHIDDVGEMDGIFFAGDLCLLGPRPERCVQLLRSREDISSIYGNTDQWIDGPPLLSDDIEEEERRRRQHIHDIASWTRVRLPEMDRAWLRELPFHRRVSPTVNPRDDLFIVHANPQDVNQMIYPPKDMQRDRFGEVVQSDHDLEPLLDDLVAGVLAFGHLHIPFVRRWRDIDLVNVSSVSISGDGDPRAKYALLTWDGSAWNSEHHYVEYDVEPEIDAYKREQPPGWQKAVQMLQERGMLLQFED